MWRVHIRKDRPANEWAAVSLTNTTELESALVRAGVDPRRAEDIREEFMKTDTDYVFVDLQDQALAEKLCQDLAPARVSAYAEKL